MEVTASAAVTFKSLVAVLNNGTSPPAVVTFIVSKPGHCPNKFDTTMKRKNVKTTSR